MPNSEQCRVGTPCIYHSVGSVAKFIVPDWGIKLTTALGWHTGPSCRPSILAGRIRQPYAGVRDYELGYWTPQMLLMRRSNFHIPRVPNFEQKNYFAKTRRNRPLFRRNSAISRSESFHGKEKILEFCFVTIFALFCSFFSHFQIIQIHIVLFRFVLSYFENGKKAEKFRQKSSFKI